MNTQRLIAPFWRRRWLILTTTLTVIAGTLFWAQGLPTVYESSLTLVAKSMDGQPIPSGQRARIFKKLWNKAVIYPVVESDVFRTQRAAGLSNDELVDQIRGSLGLTEHPHGSSTVIHLSYFDTTPERAQTMAAILGQTIETADAKNAAEGAIAFKVEQPVTLVLGTHKPRIHIIAVFALGGGVLFGLALAGLSGLVGSWRHRRQPEFNAPVI